MEKYIRLSKWCIRSVMVVSIRCNKKKVQKSPIDGKILKNILKSRVSSKKKSTPRTRALTFWFIIVKTLKKSSAMSAKAEEYLAIEKSSLADMQALVPLVYSQEQFDEYALAQKKEWQVVCLQIIQSERLNKLKSFLMVTTSV